MAPAPMGRLIAFWRLRDGVLLHWGLEIEIEIVALALVEFSSIAPRFTPATMATAPVARLGSTGTWEISGPISGVVADVDNP
jgi:hypothetical protein